MKLVIDSRERKSYALFFEKMGLKHTTKRLTTGDYSIEGYENRFSVERKELNDFVNCVTFSRARFLRELERAKKLDFFGIVVECSYYDIINHRYHSKTSPNAVISTLSSWSIKYKFPIFYVEARQGGALQVVKWAEHYLRNVSK